MSDNFDQQLQEGRRWAQRCFDTGWLSKSDIAPLDELDNLSPASLFEAGAHRPLVVAFFGGTGVGKSSLLNRLAGQPIARVGLERPTSMEVTVYLHESLSLQHLPDGFPVDRVCIARHCDEKSRQILWIDMPDIDSTEAHNRELVADWLPHIDVLIYVVSPERYRDDKGWRLLREHVREHAWLFVMNQWDLGREEQVLDFAKLLSKGGFLDPLLFRTDCRDNADRSKPDQFEELKGTIQSLTNRHMIEQLEQLSLNARREALQSFLAACLERLGQEKAIEELGGVWGEIWEDASNTLRQGLEWPMAEVARSFVRHEASPLRRSVKLDQKEPGKTGQPSILWDEWAQMQLQDSLDRLSVEAQERGLPIVPLQSRVGAVAVGGGKLMAASAQRSLRVSLAKPGNTAQRLLLKLTGISAFLLPLAAIGWVSWQAVTAYYESAMTHSGFLGADFVAHSSLLVALAWLLPFFLNQQLKPSAERTALQGVRQGVDAALAGIEAQVAELLAEYDRERRLRHEEGLKLFNSLTKTGVSQQGMLGRMIPG